MSQMKEQNKTPEKELNKIETSNRPDAEFETLALRMLSELRGRIDELNKNFNKDTGNIKTKLQNIKKNQSEMRNTLTKMKSIL